MTKLMWYWDDDLQCLRTDPQYPFECRIKHKVAAFFDVELRYQTASVDEFIGLNASMFHAAQFADKVTARRWKEQKAEGESIQNAKTIEAERGGKHETI